MRNQQGIGAPYSGDYAMRQNDVVPGTIDAPATFWEYLTTEYPPEEFMYNWQPNFVNVTATAGQARVGQNINVNVPLFVFVFRSRAVRTDTFGQPGWVYFVGIAHSASNEWTSGEWCSEIVTGDLRGNGMLDFTYPWPREVKPTTQLGVTVNNSLGTAGIRVTGLVAGLEVRRRNNPLDQMAQR